MDNLPDQNSSVLFQQEPMHDLNKQLIMRSSLIFEDQKFKPQICRSIMVQLLYLFNQGAQFDEVELEIIFFRLTKLFHYNDPQLKRMIYKILKVLYLSQLDYDVQSVLKDLISTNDFIRQNALKLIPQIMEESILMQLEKYVKIVINLIVLQALQDHRLIISNTALMVGFNIVEKFPNIIMRWYPEIIEKLDNQFWENSQYAFNLLCSIKKRDLPSLTKILNKFIKLNKTPILNIQIIRLIKEILNTKENIQTEDLINYLISQIYYKEPMIFFESVKSLIQISKISNEKLQILLKYFFYYLENLDDHIQIYTGLKIINKLLKIEKRKQLISNQNIGFIESFITNKHSSISSKAIQISIQLQSSENIQNYLKYILTQIVTDEQRTNFLNGLLELYNYDDNIYAYFFLELLLLITNQDSPQEQIILAIQVAQQIFHGQSYYKVQWKIERCAQSQQFYLQFVKQCLNTITRKKGKVELQVILRSLELNIYKFINHKYGKRWRKIKNLTRTNIWMKDLKQEIILERTQEIMEQKFEMIISNLFYLINIFFNFFDQQQNLCNK
ncbi:hypothetical protein pb186bvf_020257 [Paramecium bursaria]